MELRHLRYFIAVAEEGHVGRAAERLAMAQPPLSMQIKALEREVGVELFTRGPRGMSLTAAGEAFAPEAYEALAAADRAARAAQRAAAGESGELRVGFVSSASYGPLPEAIRRFREACPGVTLTLEELTSGFQLRGLQSGTLDLGFFRVDPGHVLNQGETGLVIEPILREPWVLAMPAGHPLEARQRVPLGSLQDEAFVGFPRRANPTLYDQLQRDLLSAGLVPRVVQEAHLMHTIVSLVAAGLGVALVPASLARLQRENLVYRPLVETYVASDLVAVWRANGAPTSLSRFMTIVREVVS